MALNVVDKIRHTPIVKDTEQRMTGIGRYDLQPFTNYLNDPPNVSCWLELPERSCLLGVENAVQLFIRNETAYPITLHPENVQTAIKCYNIDIIDLFTEEHAPQFRLCRGGKHYVGEECSWSFSTIKPYCTWMKVGVITVDLIPGRIYSIQIRKPPIRWWCYGTKQEVLAPGVFSQEYRRIDRKTRYRARNQCIK
jgi:hypothetical protein